MDTERRELWNQLENEPKRAFQAFQTFLRLPSGSRTVVEAYRRHVDNPQATRVSDTWARWSHDFAWSLRAEAYDHHLELIRERAMEEAIREEAKRQAEHVESRRFRYNELMTAAYERAIEWLEEAQRTDLRPQDVLAIIGLHMDDQKIFGVEPEPRNEGDWTEEDEAAFIEIAKEVDALTDPEHSEEEDEEDSENIEGDPD